MIGTDANRRCMAAERLKTRAVIGLCGMRAGLVFALPVRANDPSLDMWQAQRQTFESYIRNMKPLDRHRIGDVMELRLDKKFLVLRTPLNNIAAEESMRATFDGVPGLAIVSVLRGSHQVGAAEPTRFTLTLMNFPAPKQTVTLNATVDNTLHQLTISTTVQTTNGPFHQVIFSQQRGPQSAGGGSVQLMVTDARSQGVAPEQINLEGPDFFTFVREHPDEVSRYVRPLLRQLGQEAVFAPDQLTGWQVFNDLWKPDPAVARQVDELLPMLNSADYRARDAVLSRLEQLGREGAAVLIHLDRTRLSPEQNARIDRALFPYLRLSLKEVAHLRSDPVFLLDCLYSEDVGLRHAAIDRLHAVVRPDLQFDVNATPEARGAMINAMRSQLVPSPSGGTQ